MYDFLSVLLEFFANAQSMIFDLALKLFLFHVQFCLDFIGPSIQEDLSFIFDLLRCCISFGFMLY